MDLNQVTVYSDKPLDTVEFYRKLGLRLIVDSLPRYARLECPDGESTLSIHAADAVSSNQSIVLYFECDDLDTEVAELKKLGVELLQEPVEQEWLWREAYLADPNGNKICLFRAGKNRKEPPWRLKP